MTDNPFSNDVMAVIQQHSLTTIANILFRLTSSVC